jgi:hypothetical protein
MSSKKDKKTQDIQQKMDEAKKMRLSMLEAKGPKKPLDSDSYKEFEKFWARNRKSYGADRSLLNVIWSHLKAISCDKPDKFEEGIKHFGLIKGDK